MEAVTSRDVHVIAVDQMVRSNNENIINPDIGTWMIKPVGGDDNIADLWKNEEGKIEMDSMWFGRRSFDDIIEARDYVQQKYDGMSIN